MLVFKTGNKTVQSYKGYCDSRISTINPFLCFGPSAVVYARSYELVVNNFIMISLDKTPEFDTVIQCVGCFVEWDGKILFLLRNEKNQKVESMVFPEARLMKSMEVILSLRLRVKYLKKQGLLFLLKI